MYISVKTGKKKLPYFYDKALQWLKKHGKNTDHMDQVKKMVDFMEQSESKDTPSDKKK